MSKINLYEYRPGVWRVKSIQPNLIRARSRLPMPGVISDIMDPVEQVDGKFYTSKSAFRKVGRDLGLTEVGNEKPRPRPRPKVDKAGIRQAIQKAVDRYKTATTHEEAEKRHRMEMRRAK